MRDDAFIAKIETHVDLEEPIPHRASGLVRAATLRDNGGKELLAAPFMLSWKEMRERLYMQQQVPYRKLPKFVEKFLRLLWDTSEATALRAMVSGDVAFFIGWLFRLDQIDVAMIDAGYDLADRSALVRFRAAVDGYRDVAEKRLKKLGGKWPPIARGER